MAKTTNGYVNTNNYDGRYYKISWEATQSIESNTSTIDYTIEACGGNSSWYAERTLNVVIAGITVMSKTSRVERHKGVIKSGSLRIEHNEQGDASFTINVKAAVYTSSVNCTATKSFDLTTIARATVPTLNLTTVDCGTSVVISTPRVSTNFIHNLSYELEGQTGVIATNITDSFEWTVPLDLINIITHSTYSTMKIYCETFNGNNSIGVRYENLIVQVPADIVPEISISITDLSDAYSKASCYLSNVSNFDIRLTGVAKYNAEISSYKIMFDGETHPFSQYTTGIIKQPAAYWIDGEVVDSRGRVATITRLVFVENYYFPSFSFDVYRCDNRNQYSPTSSKVYVNMRTDFAPLLESTSSVKLEYKKSSETTFTPITIPTQAMSNSFVVENIDVAYSYDFRLTLKDKIKTIETTKMIPTGFTLMDFNSSGEGLAIGKISEIDNFEVAMDTVFTKPVQFGHDVVFSGSPWYDITIEELPSCFYYYGGNHQTPQYRKIGDHVFIRGRVAANADYAGNTIGLFTLPEKYRPWNTFLRLNPATGSKISRVYIGNNGVLYLDYVRDMATGQRVSGALDWIDISIDFFTEMEL